MGHGLTMTPAMADSMLDRVMETSKNMAVPWFLMASYLYYHHDHSLLSDERYDLLSKQLLESWDDITHRHKAMIDPETLKAGTAYDIAEEDYPTIIVSAACALAEIKAPAWKPRPQYKDQAPQKRTIKFVLKRKSA